MEVRLFFCIQIKTRFYCNNPIYWNVGCILHMHNFILQSYLGSVNPCGKYYSGTNGMRSHGWEKAQLPLSPQTPNTLLSSPEDWHYEIATDWSSPVAWVLFSFMFPQAGGAEILRFGICRLCQSAPLFHCFTDNGSAHQHTYWCTQCYCTLVRTSHQPPIMHSTHFILSCALLSLDEVYDPSQFRPIKNLYAQIDKHQKVRLPLDWCDPGSWTCSS